MNDVEDIKRRIKEAIKGAHGINQKVVAAKIGISTPQLSQILNDRVPGTLRQILKIVDAIDGADKHELLTGYKIQSDADQYEIKDESAEYITKMPKNRLELAYTALLEYCDQLKTENERLKKQLQSITKDGEGNIHGGINNVRT